MASKRPFKHSLNPDDHARLYKKAEELGFYEESPNKRVSQLLTKLARRDFVFIEK